MSKVYTKTLQSGDKKKHDVTKHSKIIPVCSYICKLMSVMLRGSADIVNIENINHI